MKGSHVAVRGLWACLILCVGMWLRLSLHDIHGLEGDDGVALVLTHYEVPTLIDGLRRQELDVHPPLYFLMLKGWTAAAGESLLALRLFNILADVLTASCLWALIRRVSARSATLSLTLWSIAPLLLYSLYTIRMYTLMALWVTLGIWVLADFIRRPRLITGVCLGLVCGAALLTHLYGVFLWAAAVLVILTQMSQGRLTLKDSRSAFVSLIIAGLIFLPFGLPMLERFLGGGSLGAQAGGVIAPLEMPGQLIAAMLTYRVYQPSMSSGLMLVALLFLGIYWFMSLRSISARKKQIVLVILIVCGVGMAGILLLAVGSSVYRPRYAVPFVPLLLGLIAVILVEFAKKGFRQRLLISVILVALVVTSLMGAIQNLGRNIYDDWRGAAHFIETYAQDGDVILLIPRWGTKAFDYHLRRDVPVYGLFESVTAETDLESMTPLIEPAARVWLLRYQVEGTDPTDRTAEWIQERGTIVTEVFPTAIQLQLYDLHPTAAALPDAAVPLDVQFGDVLKLHGYTLPVTSGPAHDTRLHPPSNWVQVTLYLEALASLENVTLRVRLVDQVGGVWGGALERGADVLHRFPLSGWQTGQMYEVPFDLNLNPETPPGLYRVEVMLLDAEGASLSATRANAGSNWAFAGEFEVK